MVGIFLCVMGSQDGQTIAGILRQTMLLISLLLGHKKTGSLCDCLFDFLLI
jgi:hypothetical protein